MKLCLVLASLFLWSAAHAGECRWPSNMQRIPQEYGDELHLPARGFDSRLRDSFELPQGFAEAVWRKEAAASFDVDPLALLRRQRAIYTKFVATEAGKFDRILNGTFGEITPIHCLEALLLLQHFGTGRSLADAHIEYEAKVLRNEKEVVILFEHSDEAQVPLHPVNKARTNELVSLGYSFDLQFHNHPFFPGNETGDIAGTTIPSGNSEWGDVNTVIRYHERNGLKNFRITNGFSSLSVNESQFDQLYLW